MTMVIVATIRRHQMTDQAVVVVMSKTALIRFHCRHGYDDHVVLRISPARLDRAFAATDPEFYATVHEGTVAALMALPDGVRLQAPIVGACDGAIYFRNGRHRARAAVRLGLRVIPAIVPVDDVLALRALLTAF